MCPNIWGAKGNVYRILLYINRIAWMIRINTIHHNKILPSSSDRYHRHQTAIIVIENAIIVIENAIIVIGKCYHRHWKMLSSSLRLLSSSLRLLSSSIEVRSSFRGFAIIVNRGDVIFSGGGAIIVNRGDVVAIANILMSFSWWWYHRSHNSDIIIKEVICVFA